jgi:hypothetical protein
VPRLADTAPRAWAQLTQAGYAVAAATDVRQGRMARKRRRTSALDSIWSCEVCGCSSTDTVPSSSWRPGELGPKSRCCSCSALAARAAKLSRRLRRPPIAVAPAPSAIDAAPARASSRLQLRLQQQWSLSTSVIDDPALEALMRQHTWQPGELRQDAAQSPRPEEDSAGIAQQTIGWVPPIIVRSAGGKGNGAFAAHSLHALQLVGEYCGRVVRSQLHSSGIPRDEAAPSIPSNLGGASDHCPSQQGYTFDLRCGGLVVDAALLGSLTRFINHAQPPASNVVATIVVVRGLRKIVLRTSRNVATGEELLLDYGYERAGWVDT